MHDQPLTVSLEGTLDVRPVMEYEVPYARIDLTYCSKCTNPDWRFRLRRDTTVTKHRHADQPLGHLITRCPDHQAAYIEKGEAA